MKKILFTFTEQVVETCHYLKKQILSLHSMQDLVTKYHMAPMIAAADNGVTGAYIKNGARQAFGELSATNYGINNVMSYASAQCRTIQFGQKAISENIDFLCENKFHNLLQEVIKILQARQMGCLENTSLDLSNIEKQLQQTREEVVKAWTLFYIVARYIKKTASYQETYESNNSNELFKEFLNKNLYDSIPNNFLQMSDQEKNQCLSKIEWPNYVCYEDKQTKESIQNCNNEPIGPFLTILLDVNKKDGAFLDYLMHPPPMEDNFNHYAETIENANIKLEELIKALMDGLGNPELEWTDEEKKWVTNSFPIILTLNSSATHLLEKVGHEWRSKEPLMLGEHISHVYTDTHHIKVLQNFFDENKIKVTVFDYQVLRSADHLVTDNSSPENRIAGKSNLFASPNAQSPNNNTILEEEVLKSKQPQSSFSFKS